jgi:hypothetical protein
MNEQADTRVAEVADWHKKQARHFEPFGADNLSAEPQAPAPEPTLRDEARRLTSLPVVAWVCSQNFRSEPPVSGFESYFTPLCDYAAATSAIKAAEALAAERLEQMQADRKQALVWRDRAESNLRWIDRAESAERERDELKAELERERDDLKAVIVRMISLDPTAWDDARSAIAAAPKEPNPDSESVPSMSMFASKADYEAALRHQAGLSTPGVHTDGEASS